MSKKKDLKATLMPHQDHSHKTLWGVLVGVLLVVASAFVVRILAGSRPKVDLMASMEETPIRRHEDRSSA